MYCKTKYNLHENQGSFHLLASEEISRLLSGENDQF